MYSHCKAMSSQIVYPCLSHHGYSVRRFQGHSSSSSGDGSADASPASTCFDWVVDRFFTSMDCDILWYIMIIYHIIHRDWYDGVPWRSALWMEHLWTSPMKKSQWRINHVFQTKKCFNVMFRVSLMVMISWWFNDDSTSQTWCIVSGRCGKLVDKTYGFQSIGGNMRKSIMIQTSHD